MSLNNNSNILESSGFIDIGDICNAKCYFCFNDEGPLFYPKNIIFNKIDNYVKKGIFKIRYGVGEFTMHPNFFEILEYGKNKGIEQYIHTNGIKLENINFVSKLKKIGIKNINISLHGIKAGTNDKILGKKGSFKQVLKGIDNLIKYKINISLSFVITKDNEIEILGIYLFCLKKNISMLKYSFLTGGHIYGNIIPNINNIYFEIQKVLFLNKKFNLDIKFLNIPHCLINNDNNIYEFHNNSNTLMSLLCKKCKNNKYCLGFPIYYNRNNFIKFIKNYVKN